VPLCPPQISHGLDLGSNPGLRGERPATNRLSHGTAHFRPCRHNSVFFFMVKGPAAGATNATQPWGLLCNPVMKMIRVSSFFRVMEHRWNEIDREKPTTRRKTCPSATLSTTNLTWTDQGSIPGLRGERPATNRLSHGTAITLCWKILFIYCEIITHRQ
jgi:hypothetical protein